VSDLADCQQGGFVGAYLPNSFRSLITWGLYTSKRSRLYVEYAIHDRCVTFIVALYFSPLRYVNRFCHEIFLFCSRKTYEKVTWKQYSEIICKRFSANNNLVSSIKTVDAQLFYPPYLQAGHIGFVIVVASNGQVLAP